MVYDNECLEIVRYEGGPIDERRGVRVRDRQWLLQPQLQGAQHADRLQAKKKKPKNGLGVACCVAGVGSATNEILLIYNISISQWVLSLPVPSSGW
jgi:hypothetical protein